VHYSEVKIAGIDWDDANWPKCGKHGVGQHEIEHALRHMTFRIADPDPSERRFRTACRLPSGRVVFVVFTHRERSGKTFLRPISARFMHSKEIRHYEQIEKAMADPSDR
jgi:uncharacterized DUF497 family protein